ncbi:MAG TPA: hypothetical protein DD417_13795, partial [Elusimicrobia bacterium]|nr:hypothetical protein [Elusimicrobiota bacterium]
FAGASFGAASLSPEVQVHQADLERNLENRLRDALSAYLGISEIIPVVNVSLVLEETRKELEERFGKAAVEYVLPGVPVNQNLTQKPDAPVRVARASKIVTCTIWIGKTLDPARTEQVKQVASQILEIIPAKGDSLQIKTFSARTQSAPQSLMAYVGMAATAVLLIAALIASYFLFGPLRRFFDNLVDALSKKAAPAAAEMAAFAASAGPAAGAGEAAAAGPAGGMKPTSPDEEPLFDFINEDNISGLTQALAKEGELLIASVLECLPRPVAAKAFALFTPEKRRDILLQCRSVKYGNPESIRLIEKQIRRKLGFSFGGVRKMCQIIQRTDSGVRSALIAAVEASDPELAQHLRDNLLEFEDLFDFDDRSFLRIFRELSLQSFARFLKASSPGLTDRVCERLSPEFADILREQISFMPPVPPEAADEEFIRIVDVVERLKTAGLLTLRAPAAESLQTQAVAN